MHNLCDFALIDIGDDSSNVNLVDFAKENGNWDLNKHFQVLPLDCVDRLALIMALENCLGEDSVACSLTTIGKFSVKMAHSIFLLSNNSSNRNLFQVVWKLESPQRLKSFLWLAGNNALLTNANKVRRHLTTQANCPICGATE